MKKIYSNIVNYLKKDNNLLNISIFLICFFLFFFLMRQTVLYADDFTLGIVSKKSFAAVFDYFRFHYFHWGGGYTCLLAIFFMKFNPILWQFFQTICVSTIVFLVTSLITHNRRKNKWIVYLIMWGLIYSLSIYISRETLFWMDGGLAYIFSSLQFILLFYFIYSRFYLDVKKNYDKFLLPVVVFFAGWSCAQVGFISIAFFVLLFVWIKFIEKKKIPAMFYIYFFVCLIGYCIFYFAPGNSARMSEFPEFAKLSILQKIVSRTGDIYGLMFDYSSYPFCSVLFYLSLFSTLIAVISIKTKYSTRIKKCISFICSFIILIYVLMYCLQFLSIGYDFSKFYHFISLGTLVKNGDLTLQFLFPYIFASLFMLAFICLSFIVSIERKDPFMFLISVVSLLSHGVMVMSPYSPYRTLIYIIILLSVGISYCIHYLFEKDIDFNYLLIVPIMILKVNLAYLYILVSLFINNAFSLTKCKFNKSLLCFLTILIIYSFANYMSFFDNYKLNKTVYVENISRVTNSKDYIESVDGEKVLYLVRPVSEEYGFTGFVGPTWVENDIKTYFELDSDLVLKYEELGE